ncbi:hypothetical protein IWQ61_007582, partial [Dispira simplex]
VERCIKRIREKDIECLLQWFNRTFPSSAVSGTQITYIPSRYVLCCLAFQTGQLIKLLAKLQQDTQVAFKKQHITDKGNAECLTIEAALQKHSKELLPEEEVEA